MAVLPLDGAGAVAFAPQIERPPACGCRSKELDQGSWLMCACDGAIELLGRNEHDGLAALLHDPLRAFGTHPAEELAEPSFRLVELPNRM